MNNRSFIKDELKKRSRADKENKRGELNSSPGIQSVVFFFYFEWVEREFLGVWSGHTYKYRKHLDLSPSVQCAHGMVSVQVLAIKIFLIFIGNLRFC